MGKLEQIEKNGQPVMVCYNGEPITIKVKGETQTGALLMAVSAAVAVAIENKDKELYEAYHDIVAQVVEQCEHIERVSRLPSLPSGDA